MAEHHELMGGKAVPPFNWGDDVDPDIRAVSPDQRSLFAWQTQNDRRSFRSRKKDCPPKCEQHAEATYAVVVRSHPDQPLTLPAPVEGA
jgi:hypothetical protein